MAMHGHAANAWPPTCKHDLIGLTAHMPVIVVPKIGVGAKQGGVDDVLAERGRQKEGVQGHLRQQAWLRRSARHHHK